MTAANYTNQQVPYTAEEQLIAPVPLPGYTDSDIDSTPEPFRRIRPLGIEEVKAVVTHEIDDALGGLGSRIAEERRQAIRFYYGRPFGNEQEGRSRVILTDVADTIEWIMPSIMRMVAESGIIWEFQPTRPGAQAEEQARQASDVINHIFLNRCGGWMILYDWIKTALIEKNGFVKAEFIEKMEPKRDTYRGLTEAEVGMILQDETVEIIEMQQHDEDRALLDIQTGQPVPTFDVTTLRIETVGEFKVSGIAPENFLMARRAIKLDDEIVFCGNREKVMVSDLIAMGYDPDLVSTVPSDDTPEYSQGRVERLSEDETFPVSTADRPDPASREIWVSDVSIRLDEDGDGYSELRNILAAGTGPVTILDDHEINGIPYANLTAVPMPHKFFGRSIADQVMDLQLIRSTLLRQMLDNIYLTNDQRWEVTEGMVNIDDLITSRPGGVVRVTTPGHINSLDTKPLPRHAMEMMTFLSDVRETRTGVGKWVQGPEPQAIKNQTLGAVNSVQAAAGAKIGIIAKIFAETGIKDLGRILYRLFVESATRPMTMRLRGHWVDVDPTRWSREMDCTVELGLGVGAASERMQHLGFIAEKQQSMLEGGLGGLLVTPKNLFNTAMAVQEAMGLRHDSRFFTNPGDKPFPQRQPAESDKIDMLEAEVKQAEHKRRSSEDQQTASRDAARVMVDANSNEKLQEFRFADMANKLEMERLRLESQERVAQLQIEGQIKSAMASHVHREGATQ